MSLSSLFDGLAEVRAALLGDLNGQLLDATRSAEMSELQGIAEVTAVAAHELSAAGDALGLKGLEMLAVKGPTQSTVAAFRSATFVTALLDPTRPAGAVEKVLSGWSPEATPPPAAGIAARPPPAGPPPPPADALDPPEGSAPAAAAPAALAPDPAPREPAPARVPASETPWVLLRRAVVRGLLSDASARVRQIADLAPLPEGRAPPLGAEPLDAAELDEAASTLLEGVGWVLAGDCIGGHRRLGELTNHRNRSFRWLAQHWSARATLQSGDFAATTALTQAAIELGEEIDLEARAISLWCGAEARAQTGQPTEGLRQLSEARQLFELHRDGWGLGQTWLAEARILAAQGREAQSANAALQASGVNPGWEGPRIFLARRALLRQDYDEAERILRSSRSSEAERERRLIELIREGAVTQDNAADFLRVREAPPNGTSLRLLLKVARGSPRFTQAREVLAWMLLKLGKYADAETIFRGLLSLDLSQLDRASVNLGLSCIANASLGDGLAGAAGGSPGDATPASPSALSSSLVNGAGAPSGSGRLHTVFSGELGVFPLPDLLEFLRSGRRSGTLVCSCHAGMGTLHFIEGRITGAASPTTPVLGQVLIAAQKVEEKALLEVVVAQQSQHSEQPLGWLLVQQGLVDTASVRAALERQIVLALKEMVAWKEGQFAFDSKVVPERLRPEIEVEVDPQVVLLNLFKEMDEAAAAAAAAARPLPEGDEL